MSPSKIWLSLLIASILFSSCEQDIVIGDQTQQQFFLKHDGAVMPVVVEGNTASKTFLIMLHGGPGGDAQIYNTAIPQFSDPLEESMAVVYWDQRAAGNSGGNFDPSLLNGDQLANDLEALILTLQYQYGEDIGIFLMGHSWGGGLATIYLNQHPEADFIKGWIDVDGVHNFAGFDRHVLANFQDKLPDMLNRTSQQFEWEGINNFIATVDSNTISRAESNQMNQSAYFAEFYMQADQIINPSQASGTFEYVFFSNHNYLTATSNAIISNGPIWSSVQNRDYTQALQDLDYPALFLWGEWDFVVPTSMGKEALAAYGSEYKTMITFDRSAHSPMVTQPIEVADAILQFVEEYR
ncbi:MAG: alpha/beta hydrolase [Bacteroidota bacterium]